MVGPVLPQGCGELLYGVWPSSVHNLAQGSQDLIFVDFFMELCLFLI